MQCYFFLYWLTTSRLQGNPLCSNENLVQFCGSMTEGEDNTQNSTNSESNCRLPQSCPPPYEYAPPANSCFCAAPLLVGYRLKSPGFFDFLPYFDLFEQYITSGLNIRRDQLEVDSFLWIKGPRLRMYLKFFPVYENERSNHTFNRSEVRRIRSMFTGWTIPDSEIFGPYELLNFTLLDPYKDGLSLVFHILSATCFG